MQPSETQKDIREAAVPGIPQAVKKHGKHQRLEIDDGRRMEVHRLKFGDVLQLVRVGDVFEQCADAVPSRRG